jgi:hypothetical protein
MALHTDIPTRSEIDRLLSSTSQHCVSIYLPTHRVTQDTAQDRLVLRDLTRQAVEQLHAAGASGDDVADIEEHLLHLVEDDEEFWNDQAESLAIFASPDRFETHRLPNHLTPMVEVSDRFHLKPLLRGDLPARCVDPGRVAGLGAAARDGPHRHPRGGPGRGPAQGCVAVVGQQGPPGA